MDNNNIKNLASKNIRVANFFTAEEKRNHWGPRIIDDYELILIIEGRAWYKEDKSEKRELFSGDILLIPPNKTHIFHCELDKKCTISCIHFSFKNSNFKPLSNVATIQGSDPLVNLLFRSVAAEFIKKSETSDKLVNLMVDQILLKFYEAVKSIKVSYSKKTKQAISYIEQNYAEQFSRNKVAAYIAVTPEYLSTLIKKETGKNLVDLLMQIRLSKSFDLLKKPHMNISQVAFACGFDDPLYFSRVFKKRIGISPREYAKLI